LFAPLVQSADFQRVLAAPMKARSEHFAVHHLLASPADRRKVVPDLSTESAPDAVEIVDNLPHWLGMVVPKRHAKRAVTRNLVKRQMRALFAAQLPVLPGGLWILRLRRPLDRQQFPSAASDALRSVLRAELTTVLQRAAAR
jgi:ribonuclease P protein component